ncbi:MAG: hypothetical protein GKS05_05075 [Nitrospirales bacterium]|nr:hypothetical protein [Nitrospirales bacterium]
MALKRGDILDERKRFPESCGLVVKVMGGGEGFKKILCCGHELTEEDRVPTLERVRGRKKGKLPVGVVLDEKKSFPDSCGLRMMVLDGGAGFQEIQCCGHSVQMRAIQDFQYGGMRQEALPDMEPHGNA